MRETSNDVHRRCLLAARLLEKHSAPDRRLLVVSHMNFISELTLFCNDCEEVFDNAEMKQIMLTIPQN